MKNLLAFGIAALILVPLFGCNSGQVGMGGRVTYSDTGEPLEAGTVSFTTPTFHARGEIQKDGKYTIGSFSEKDGLPPGKYQVYISGAVREEGRTPQGMPILVPLIDAKFTDPAKSGITCEVTAATKTLDIKVDRAPAKSDKKK